MPAVAQGADGVVDLIDAHAALHRVEDFLRAAFGADPDAEAAEVGECVGDGRVHAVGPSDAFERDAKVARAHFCGELLDPAGVDGEDVVGDPELIGVIAVANPEDLVGNGSGRSAAMRFSVDEWLHQRQMVRAASRRDDGDRSAAVMSAPGVNVFRHVDAVAVGPGLSVEIRDFAPRVRCGRSRLRRRDIGCRGRWRGRLSRGRLRARAHLHR